MAQICQKFHSMKILKTSKEPNNLLCFIVFYQTENLENPKRRTFKKSQTAGKQSVLRAFKVEKTFLYLKLPKTKSEEEKKTKNFAVLETNSQKTSHSPEKHTKTLLFPYLENDQKQIIVS